MPPQPMHPAHITRGASVTEITNHCTRTTYVSRFSMADLSPPGQPVCMT